MKAAINAWSPPSGRAERGTIGAQIEVLRAQTAAAGGELAGEYPGDGHSRARLAGLRPQDAGPQDRRCRTTSASAMTGDD